MTRTFMAIALLSIALPAITRADDTDLLPRMGETTREYQARISGDKQRLEAVKRDIAQEHQAADELALKQQQADERARANRAIERNLARSNALYEYSIESSNAYRRELLRPKCNPLSPHCNY